MRCPPAGWPWHLAAGDLAPATAIWTELVAHCPPGEIRAEALAQLADKGAEGLDWENGVEMAAQAVAESTTVRSRVRRMVMYAQAMSVGDQQRALKILREAAAEARAAGDDVALAAVLPDLGSYAALCAPELDGLPLLREAVELESRVHGAVRAYLAPETRLGVVLMTRNELAEARALLSRHLEACVPRGDEGGATGVAFHLADLELRAGDLDRVEAHIDWVLRSADNGQPAQELCLHLMLAALIAAHRGEVEKAQLLNARVRQMHDLVGDPLTACAHPVVAGYLELSLGNYSAAL